MSGLRAKINGEWVLIGVGTPGVSVTGYELEGTQLRFLIGGVPGQWLDLPTSTSPQDPGHPLVIDGGNAFNLNTDIDFEIDGGSA
jgi:hypothetical protein